MSLPTVRRPFRESSNSTTTMFSEVGDICLTDDDIYKQVQELKHEIKVLTIENEILENTLSRVDPASLVGLQQAIEGLQSMMTLHPRSMTSNIHLSVSKNLLSPSCLRISPSKASSTRKIESSAKLTSLIFGTGPKVNIIERSELVAQEIEYCIEKGERVKRRAAKQLALLKAQLEEIGIRVSEIEKSGLKFKKEVIEDGVDPIAQRIPAEIWIRNMNDWVRLVDKQIGKLRLRTSTYNTQYKKLTGEIKVKGDLKESLQPVDFKKMKIHNEECEQLIEEKNTILTELKFMTGEANLNLTITKYKLQEQMQYLSNVENLIKERGRQIIRIDKERDKIKIQADDLEKKLASTKKVRAKWLVPDVMEYVKIKAEIDDLKTTIKTLEIRLRLHKSTLTGIYKQMRQKELTKAKPALSSFEDFSP